MPKIYSYVLRTDSGAAPNPFWKLCTLTICKPAIRRTADIDDWIVGTGSAIANCNGTIRDLSHHIVYAMKVTDKKTLKEYDTFCNENFPNKVPNIMSSDWRRKVGDSIYDYSVGNDPAIRIGVHNEVNKKADLSGHNALLSNHFYYFGQNAPFIDNVNLYQVVKMGRGHKITHDPQLLAELEEWLIKYEADAINAEPQRKFEFDKELSGADLQNCANRCFEDDADEDERDG